MPAPILRMGGTTVTRQCEGCGRWLRSTGRHGVWRYCRPCYERNRHLRALLEPLRVAMLDVDWRRTRPGPRESTPPDTSKLIGGTSSGA